jgi:drug/metabolite transporter (DMT)-like permease
MYDSDTASSADRRRGIGLAFAAAIVSGFAVFINSYGVRAVPDATVYTTAKNLIAAVLLVAFAASTMNVTRARPPARPRPIHVVGLAAVAVVGGSAAFVLFFEGLAQASSSQAAFIHKTLVIWVALLAVPLLSERLNVLHVLAIAVLVLGQAALAGGLSGFRLGSGEWLVFGATALWTVEIVLAKRLLRDLPASLVGVARMAAGAVLLVVWLGITGRWSQLIGLDREGWTWALLTGTVLAGYVALWFSALALAPAVDVTAVLVVAAVITGVLNVAVKGATVTAWSVTGMVVIVVGAALAVWAGRERSARRMVAV